MRSSNIIGVPVLTEKAEHIETVQEPIFDLIGKSVLGFLVDKGGWVGSARVLPWAGVLRIDQGAIVTRSKKLIVNVAQIGEIKQLLEGGHSLIGVSVKDHDEREIGIVTDLFFDEQTGKIDVFVVSEAVPLAFSDRPLFVPASALMAMQDGTGKALTLPMVLQLMSGPSFAPLLEV